jgi:Fe-S-cluster-containing dehydrogenase component
MSEQEKTPTPQPQAQTPPAAEVKTPPPSQLLSRREFVAGLVGAGVTFVLATTLAEPLDTMARDLLQPTADDGHGGGESPYHWAMVIDLSKCIDCVYACQATNDTRDDARWNVRVEDVTPQGDVFHVTRPCLHCHHAPCVSVCPVGATYSRPDGLVVMDYDKCIGCRYCQTACPYGARVFNWEERPVDDNTKSGEWGTPEVPRRPRGVAEKCTFCIHRIDAGLAKGLMPGVDKEATPACVNICPVEARFFGNLKDPNSTVYKIIHSRPTLRLREDLGTDPSVYYIPPEGLF